MSKKSSYWQERFTEEEERINKDARAYAKRIEQQYDIVLRNIERDINDWYMRIAKNNNVSLLEAKRMLSAKELAEFKWSVKEYIKAGETNAISPIWMKELENASARVHISRLEALKIQIQNEVEGIYGVRDKEMQNYLIRTYGETYYHTAYEIQKGNGIGWSLNRLDTNKVNTIIHKPWAADGKNFSERIWEDKTKLINTLHTGLTQNFIRGEAPDKLISSITKEFNIKKSVAARLVMTESAAYSSQAREKSFKALNLSKYEIVATLDSKTSEICQEMDGKVFDMKDYQVGITAPPFHVWCRTTTAPWFPENFDAERIARGTDGKTYKIPENMKYKEWKEKYVKEDTNTGLTYIEESALMKYKSPSMYILNDKLRNGIELSIEEKEWVKNLDSALKKMPKYEGELIRTLDIKNTTEFKTFIWDCVPGKKIFDFKAYTSTSKGEIYDDNMPIRLIIPNSKKARDISKFGLSEDEVLYERNCKFKVLNVEYTQDNKFYIYLEELNE
nr:MAG TPA: minor capsid protein [Caudoviricetes sp.]